jgi:hypothetical protein
MVMRGEKMPKGWRGDFMRLSWGFDEILERVEEMSGRSVTQMVKRLTDAAVV